MECSHALLFICFFMAAFRKLSGWHMHRDYMWPAKPKIFAVWTFIEKVSWFLPIEWKAVMVSNLSIWLHLWHVGLHICKYVKAERIYTNRIFIIQWILYIIFIIQYVIFIIQKNTYYNFLKVIKKVNKITFNKPMKIINI